MLNVRGSSKSDAQRRVLAQRRSQIPLVYMKCHFILADTLKIKRKMKRWELVASPLFLIRTLDALLFPKSRQ